MPNKKQGAIFLVLIVLLVGTVFLYEERFGSWPWQKKVNLPSGQIAADQNWEGKEPRQVVMEDVAARIGALSPEEPVRGGKWYVGRYWFIDGFNDSFYVEYEDGHTMRRMLLSADLSQMPEIGYEVQAFFEPGESDWILKNGQDQTSKLPLILFEYDSEKSEWKQKN